jgi:hypothetical protein
MSNAHLRNITNNFQDARLASLASWPAAREINPRDRGGPYMVTQEGYDPEDMKVAADEFVLGRSGKWLSLKHFFRMPVEDRRAEFVFGTAAEVMQMMRDLPSKVEVVRGQPIEASASSTEQDEMAAAYYAGMGRSRGSAA